MFHRLTVDFEFVTIAMVAAASAVWILNFWKMQILWMDLFRNVSTFTYPIAQE